MFLEALALIPQLYMISKTGEAETITSRYLLALGGYHTLHAADWIYSFYMEYNDVISLGAGIVLFAFYFDFLYLYIITKGEEISKKYRMCMMHYYNTFSPICVCAVVKGKESNLPA